MCSANAPTTGLLAAALCATYLVIGACTETVTVVVLPAGLRLTPTDTIIPQGRVLQLHASVVDTAGNPIPGLVPTFSSNDTLTARVSPSGLVTPSGRIGSVRITAQLLPFIAHANVTIRDSNIVHRVPLAGGPFGNAISSDGTVYVTRVHAAAVSRFDLTARTFTATVTVGSVPTRVAFNSNGTIAYVTNQHSQNVGILNVATNSQTSVIQTTGDPVPLALSTDGSALFVTTNVNRLYRFSLATRLPTDSLPLPATSHHLAVHPNGTFLYVATRDGGSVLEVDANTLDVTRTFTLGGQTNGIVLSPDAGTLYVANDGPPQVQVMTLSTGATDAIALDGNGAFGLGLGPDGSKLYVSLTYAGKVQVIDRASRQIVRTIVTGGAPRLMVADPSRQLVVVSNEGGWVDLVR